MADNTTAKHPHTVREALELVTMLAAQPRQMMLAGMFESKKYALIRDLEISGYSDPQKITYQDRSDRTYIEVF